MRINQKTYWQLKLDILEFAYSNGLMIHPDKDLDGFCKRTVEDGHCICKDQELYCPCDTAILDCRSAGHCTCRLFIRPDLYKGVLESSRARLQGRENERARKSGQSIRGRPLLSLPEDKRANSRR